MLGKVVGREREEWTGGNSTATSFMFRTVLITKCDGDHIREDVMGRACMGVGEDSTLFGLET